MRVSYWLLLGALGQSSSGMAQSEAEYLYRPVPAETLPQRSKQGEWPVGVKTLTFRVADSLDLKTQQPYSRPLTVEVWYPATAALEKPAVYLNQTRSGKKFAIAGTALRDAKFATTSNLPLVVISHGYTGYRSLMFYLAEHLASHGYVVAAVDHTDSTNAEIDFAKAPFAGFLSTLYYRSRDQQATLDYLLSSTSPFSHLLSKHSAGLIGYSMGGFGLINTLGACYQFPPPMLSQLTGATSEEQLTKLKQLLESCSAARQQVDTRWQAAVAIAPWGGQYQLLSQTSLKRLKTPLLYIAGDQDDVSGYQGIKWLFDHTGSRQRYLLTYRGARHNIAGHPAPLVARQTEGDFGHYADATWDTQVLNQLNKHFVLTMMDCHLKQQSQACQLLNPEHPQSDAGTGWPGLAPRYNTGMSWLTGDASQSGDNEHKDSGTASERESR